MHADSGELVLRAADSEVASTLAKHADGALYDPALELLWFRDGDELRVLDLRLSPPQPVVIARGVPAINRFSIDHPTGLAETEDNCDLPVISLDWRSTPSIDCALEPTPNMHIENTAWLQANLKRTARDVAERHEFGERKSRLPSKLLHCEDPEACGSTLTLGALGVDLIQVTQNMGGDCWQRACLMRDPRTGRFATPPKASTWGAAESTPVGPCGIFLFDGEGRRFLWERLLCAPQHGCEELAGMALGWRVPGDRVGAPGSQ